MLAWNLLAQLMRLSLIYSSQLVREARKASSPITELVTATKVSFPPLHCILLEAEEEQVAKIESLGKLSLARDM